MCRLIGLTWQRVSLTEGKVYVREQHQAAFGTTAPKSQRGIRTVDLPPGAITVLERLAAEQGAPDGPVLVFPGLNGPRHFKTILTRLYEAMETAGIPRSGEHLDPPTSAKNSFHDEALCRPAALDALPCRGVLGRAHSAAMAASCVLAPERPSHPVDEAS